MNFVKIGQILQLTIIGLLGLIIILSTYLVVLYRRQQTRKFILTLSAIKFPETVKVASARMAGGDVITRLLADIAITLQKLSARKTTDLRDALNIQHLRQYLETDRPNCYRVPEIENLWQKDRNQLRELQH